MALVYGNVFDTFNKRKYFCYVSNEYSPCIPKVYEDGKLAPIRDETIGLSRAMFSTAVIVDAYLNGFRPHLPNVFDFQEVIKNIQDLIQEGSSYQDQDLQSLIRICRKILPEMVTEYDRLTAKLIRKNPRKYRGTVNALDYLKTQLGS